MLILPKKLKRKRKERSGGGKHGYRLQAKDKNLGQSVARIVLILAVGDVSSSTTAAQPQLCTLDFDSLCEQFATKLPQISGMQGKSLVSPISTVDSVTRLCFSTPCIGTAKSEAVLFKCEFLLSAC
ncbi:hypothetical protein SDJN02_21008, partial [Cucurbita argyrosperma subsp. argyrosperma]